ncbi:MAG: hypothetical protein EHM36_08585 [Deltaproteobacteria bacterium]|nr:MAG: hypothetical protein EHM36_08585 [Deltaproteobacteria bacterium]
MSRAKPDPHVPSWLNHYHQVRVHRIRCPKPPFVIPAKAGIQMILLKPWIPAFAGMTDWRGVTYLRGAVLSKVRSWQSPPPLHHIPPDVK